MQSLLRLVKIGELRNGRAIYMPEPEAELIWHDAYEAACVAFVDVWGETDVMFAWFNAQTFCANLRALFVDDQQRIYDAILTGETRPFERRKLPTFAQIYRMG